MTPSLRACFGLERLSSTSKITNEHVIEYYQGVGCQSEHWTFADELIVVDASPITGKRIGNRLDGRELAEAASSLLIALPGHYFPGR